MIAFEVILGVLTGGAVNALKATGVGAKIMAASSKIKNTVGLFGDDLARVSQGLLNDVGDVILPKQVVTPDGRVFKMKRNDLMDDGRSQNMKMDGKDGGGKEKDVKSSNRKQHELDDAIDEHDLGEMSEHDRDALFKRDAERGIHRGQRIRTKDKAHLLELDRIDVKNDIIIEDKKAKGFDRNPKGVDAAIDGWVEKNLYNNAKKKIDFIETKSDHVFYDNKDKLSSPYLPDISDIKDIKTIKYKLRASEGAYEGKLDEKVKEAIEKLKKENPDWKIDIEYK